MKPTHLNTLSKQRAITAIILATNPDGLQKTVNNICSYAKVVVGCHDDMEVSNAEVVRLPRNKSRSVAKNVLLESANDWILALEPGEEIIGWKFDPQEVASYSLPVLRNGIITKEIRLWHASKRLRFKNPIFETIYDPLAHYLDIPILSKSVDYIASDLEDVKEWQKDSPSSADPYYYRACVLLGQSNYSEFLNTADHYLFREREGLSAVMINYYSAMVRLYQLEDTARSMQQVVQCLACNPLMAEFWCLLGDIYYKLKKYDKSKAFYENAIILGSRRHKSDPWPIELAKYRKYPTKMIESCEQMAKETTMLVGSSAIVSR
jgi:tetratricopeptide (TPR) repeat protein